MGTNELDSGRLNLAFDCFDPVRLAVSLLNGYEPRVGGGDIAAAPNCLNGFGSCSIQKLITHNSIREMEAGDP